MEELFKLAFEEESKEKLEEIRAEAREIYKKNANENTAYKYLNILQELIKKQEKGEMEETVKEAREIYENNVDEDIELCYYSSIENLKIFLNASNDNDNDSDKEKKNKDKGCILRLNNANYMNDPEEGKIILPHLEKAKDLFNKNNDLEVSSVYLYSLTKSKDILPMWSQYGKDGKGICLVLNKDLFAKKDQNIIFKSVKADIIEQKLSNDENDTENISIEQEKEKFEPYNICYINKCDDIEKCGFYVNGKENEEIKAMFIMLQGLLGEVDINNEKVKKYVKESIEEIQYLFKSTDYKHEEEIRILKLVTNINDKRIKINESKEPVPEIYFEPVADPLRYDEIVLGPKVEKPTFVVPYIKHCNKHIKVSKSKIRYI